MSSGGRRLGSLQAPAAQGIDEEWRLGRGVRGAVVQGRTEARASSRGSPGSSMPLWKRVGRPTGVRTCMPARLPRQVRPLTGP